ncbi:hypothetical protein VP01_164g4 [Puccinia sorghi]|uniref:Uncharacterized protein n=1 Tax=Puccinia sorghi TaxID=27349 RepID=A0A0L6VGK5_9BASI|nr:hypothetical protein VP01_164g4 [Puccinia sorghi]
MLRDSAKVHRISFSPQNLAALAGLNRILIGAWRNNSQGLEVKLPGPHRHPFWGLPIQFKPPFWDLAHKFEKICLKNIYISIVIPKENRWKILSLISFTKKNKEITSKGLGIFKQKSTNLSVEVVHVFLAKLHGRHNLLFNECLKGSPTPKMNVHVVLGGGPPILRSCFSKPLFYYGLNGNNIIKELIFPNNQIFISLNRYMNIQAWERGENQLFGEMTCGIAIDPFHEELHQKMILVLNKFQIHRIFVYFMSKCTAKVWNLIIKGFTHILSSRARNLIISIRSRIYHDLIGPCGPYWGAQLSLLFFKNVVVLVLNQLRLWVDNNESGLNGASLTTMGSELSARGKKSRNGKEEKKDHFENMVRILTNTSFLFKVGWDMHSSCYQILLTRTLSSTFLPQSFGCGISQRRAAHHPCGHTLPTRYMEKGKYRAHLKGKNKCELGKMRNHARFSGHELISLRLTSRCKMRDMLDGQTQIA